jgi:MSHA biogenesis protein MshL
MAPDIAGRVTNNLHDVTLNEALDVILTPLGLQYRIDGRLLRVFKPQMESRTFSFDYVNAQRTLSRSLAASATAGFGAALGGSVGAAGVPGGSIAGGSATSINSTQATDLMKDIEESLKKLTSSSGNIVFSKMSGQIFATDYPKNLDAIQLFLENVQNAVNRQVVIEAKLIEVQLNQQSQAGVNWSVALGNTFTFSASLSPQTIAQAGITHRNFSAIVNALATQGKVNLRSAPAVVTLNNQPAVIRIGTQDVFFITTTQTDPRTGTIVQTATTPATVNEGVVLDVTPHISDDGIITMEIHPTLTDRTGQATSSHGDTAPITSVQEADTLVRVSDGDTVVIAGLISERTTQDISRVPIISDLPLIGGLFKRIDDQTQKSDLAVLLTPRIVNLRTILDYSHARQEELEDLRQEQQRTK